MTWRPAPAVSFSGSNYNNNRSSNMTPQN